MTWGDRLRGRIGEVGGLLCVGLDPDPARFPAPLRRIDSIEDAIVSFNAEIVAVTADLACAYKPNLGFYLAHGVPGLRALERTRALLPVGVPAILDAKIGDIGSTAAAYARGVVDTLGVDAVTVNPYLGEDALEPFLGRPDTGVFVLWKTSNPGGGDFQDLPMASDGPTEPLHLAVARRIARWDAIYPATVGLVVGATYPAEMATVRVACPDQPVLLPGVGAQEGDLAAAVRAGVDGDGGNLIVAVSRAILYAGDGADWVERSREAAVALHAAIEAARRLAAA
ncbi:MAG TPA: orotidine-5'-phosphate decarboxylase [Thermomicrobiales bacterium]|nr:orotidine-5'-phosphate decarboxylase [Thermomicrobiales bacterium]